MRVHPLAWWIWALGLATAASRTNNPLFLLLIMAIAGFVVAQCRTEQPWARSFRLYVYAAIIVVLIRTLFALALPSTDAGTLLFSLPQVTMPDWFAGLRLGGDIYAEGILRAIFDGMRLAALIICVGAANTLANPKRLMRCVPAALYELGTATVIALAVAPSLIQAVGRVKRTRALRNSTERGVAAMRSVLIPVLDDALEQSMSLAAAMDARGYARCGHISKAERRLTSSLLLVGLIGVCAGVYGLLSQESTGIFGPQWLILGLVLCAAAFYVANRRASPTSYRPDPWRWQESYIGGAGILTAVIVIAVGWFDPWALIAPLDPLAFPQLNWALLCALMVAASVVLVSPQRRTKAVKA